MTQQGVVSSLIQCSSVVPPKPEKSETGVSNKVRITRPAQTNTVSTKTTHASRRDAVTLISLVATTTLFSSQNHALAFELGISGPKNWLKEQKKKAVKFLLAPIYASRESLQAAYLLLSEGKNEYTSADLEQAQNLFRSAARDCVVQERNSLVAFQANTGVEVCTFTLIVKNAASLLAEKNPVKLTAEAKLRYLIRSLTALTDVASEMDIQSASNRQKVTDALLDTMSSLDKFEQGIKDCLEA